MFSNGRAAWFTVIGVGVALFAACAQPQPTPTPEPTPTPTATAIPTVTPSPSPETLSEILARAANVTVVKYDLVTSSPQGTQTTKIWVRGNKWRIELPWWWQTAGGPLQQERTGETRRAQGYLIDTEANIVYTLYNVYSSPQGTYGIIVEKSPLIHPGEILGPGSVSTAQVIAMSDPKVVGTETIDGKACLVVEYVPRQIAGVQGQTAGKAWIWKEHPFLVRNEVTIAGRTGVFEFKNIEFDVPDSVFERESSFLGVEPFLK